MNIKLGDTVNVTAKPYDTFHDFTGTIVEIEKETVVVKDQDDDRFCVMLDQCELSEE